MYGDVDPDEALRRARIDHGADEHSRQQLVLGVADRGLGLEIAGGGIDQRVDGSDLAVEGFAGEGIDTVLSANSYRLTANVENATLTGHDDINVIVVDNDSGDASLEAIAEGLFTTAVQGRTISARLRTSLSTAKMKSAGA